MEATTNYDIFKKHVSNRQIHKKTVKDLEKSITETNLLNLRPILVDKQMRIIDGQHRLEAAKNLGLPIYYEIHEFDSPECILRLNSIQKNWDSKDFLDYYCSIGREDYLKFRDFLERNGLRINIAICLFWGVSGKDTTKFKKGMIKYPSYEKELQVFTMLERINKIIDFLEQKLLGKKEFIRGTNFYRAVTIFLSAKFIDFDTFMRKLEFRLDLMRSCGRIADFLEIFRAIYNYKNSQPVDKIEMD